MNWRRPWPWLLMLATALAAIGFYLHRRELQWQEWRMREAQWRARKDYSAQTMPCTLRFARGGVMRVEAYDESFRWAGHLPELAHGSDDSEGETWAEFYALDGATAAADLLANVHADSTHLLLRQRLVFHYFLGRSDASAALLWRPLLQTNDAGWSLRVSWIETPHGIARAAAPESAYAPPRTQLPLSEWRRVEAGGGFQSDWHTLDSGTHPQRDAWYEAQRTLQRDWGRDARQLAEWRERYAREHVHFHVVEAARAVGDGQVLVLRRFGPIQGATTLARSMQEIADMAASLRCAPR